MDQLLRHAFIDEFGGVALFTPDEPCLVVAALVSQSPRPLELIIKRAHERFGSRSLSGEMKAARSTKRAIRWVLTVLASHDVAIVAVAVDKRRMVKRPRDAEDLYRQAMTRVVRLCVERWPRLEAILDKRYTHEGLRQELEFRIREGLTGMPGQLVVIHQEDSLRVKALQAADYVAWAVGQKHAWGDSSYCRLIDDRIVAEEVIEVR